MDFLKDVYVPKTLKTLSIADNAKFTGGKRSHRQLMSLFEDLMKEMKDLKDAQANILSKLNGIDLDAINKRLDSVDELCKDLQDKHSSLIDRLSDFASLNDLELLNSQFVTWPALEDALKGVRLDLENLQPISEERVVIELGTQTDVVETKSRPTSARPISRASSARSRGSASGPSLELLDVLERLGKLSEAHDALQKRVEELEKLIQEKANKSDLQGLGGSVDIPEDLLSTLQSIKDELQALKEGQLRAANETDKTLLSLSVTPLDQDMPLQVPPPVSSIAAPSDIPHALASLSSVHRSPECVDRNNDLSPLLRSFSKDKIFHTISKVPSHSSPDSTSISPEDLVCNPSPSPSPPPCLSTLPSSHSSNAVSPVTPPLPNISPRPLPPIGSNGNPKPTFWPPHALSETSQSPSSHLQPPRSKASSSPPPIHIDMATHGIGRPTVSQSIRQEQRVPHSYMKNLLCITPVQTLQITVCN
ncbi:glutamine-rich protein 2 [Plakobranchus ocellatus]|uniref:Glutamine-rich protein 2 n=1 Tax=Plakobranchus ocellatus TaxID=259542 RepID=A0AAV4AYR7_9GAST|nr:glutamine-rich protein 2 [Plakobranchus ocellatus]